MTDFKDLVQIRYSCRNYSPIAIDNSIVEQLLETAHFAPSATNAQPWKVYVVSGEKLRSSGCTNYISESTLRRLEVEAVPLKEVKKCLIV